MISIVNHWYLLLSVLVWCYFIFFWIFMIDIVLRVGNLVFVFGKMCDECSNVMVGHTFFLWLGIRLGSSRVVSSLTCFGCFPVKLRFSTLEGVWVFFVHMRICLLSGRENHRFLFHYFHFVRSNFLAMRCEVPLTHTVEGSW